MVKKRGSVAILSDQVLFRRGVSELLRAKGFHVAELATSAELRGRPPSILFIDLDHEREDTMTLVRALRHELAGTRLVVIGTALRQSAADSSFDAEVETPTGDVQALVAAAEQRPRASRRSPEARRLLRLWERVTPRQRDVLRWLAGGSDNRTIARKLRIGERAVKAHISALLVAFSVDNRTQLALLADHAGLRPPARARATFPLVHG